MYHIGLSEFIDKLRNGGLLIGPLVIEKTQINLVLKTYKINS